MSELCWDFTSGINLYITSCWTPSSLPLALPSPSLLMLSVPPGGGWRSLCGPSSSLVWHLCLWSQQPHAWVARHFYVFGFSGAILCAATDCCPQGFCGEYVGGERWLLCPGFFPARQMPSQPQNGHSAFTTVKWPAEGWLGAGFNSFTTMRYDTLMELKEAYHLYGCSAPDALIAVHQNLKASMLQRQKTHLPLPILRNARWNLPSVHDLYLTSQDH